jgi:predicted GNAT family N-acyltransferase
MQQSNDRFVWWAHWPLTAPGAGLSGQPLPPAWLDEIWSLRGYVLYNNGQRPQFKVAEHRYTDLDPADFASSHLLAYGDGKLVGCARLLPLTNGSTGLTESCLGKGPLEQMLQDLGVERAEAIEGGRWLAHPDHRHHRLGVLLAAAAVTLARHLGYRILLCSVGTQNKQHRVLACLGLRPVPTVASFYSETFADTLQVMYITPSQPTPHFGATMDMMVEKLGLTRKVGLNLHGASCGCTCPQGGQLRSGICKPGLMTRGNQFRRRPPDLVPAATWT